MELLLRIGGATVGALLAFALALADAILGSWLIAGRHTPIGPVVAVLGNLAVVWFTHAVTRHRLLAALPGVVWFATTMILSQPRREGDLILLGNWVGVWTLLAGSLAWGVGAYRLITRRPPRAAPAPTNPVAEVADPVK
jgi:hypothetical protein